MSVLACEFCGTLRPGAAPPPERPTGRAHAFGLACAAHMAELTPIGHGPQGGWLPGRHEAWLRQMGEAFPEFYGVEPVELAVMARDRYERERDTARARYDAQRRERGERPFWGRALEGRG